MHDAGSDRKVWPNDGKPGYHRVQRTVGDVAGQLLRVKRKRMTGCYRNITSLCASGVFNYSLLFWYKACWQLNVWNLKGSQTCLYISQTYIWCSWRTLATMITRWVLVELASTKICFATSNTNKHFLWRLNYIMEKCYHVTLLSYPVLSPRWTWLLVMDPFEVRMLFITLLRRLTA